jgi:hypothetical protein
VEGVVAVAQDVGGAAAHDNAPAGAGHLFDYLVEKRDHASGVKYVRIFHGKAALVAATGKNFSQTVEQRIAPLVMVLGRRGRNTGELGDFFSECLIPQMPIQAPGEFRGNHGAAASVFALERQDAQLHEDDSWQWAGPAPGSLPANLPQ